MAADPKDKNQKNKKLQDLIQLQKEKNRMKDSVRNVLRKNDEPSLKQSNLSHLSYGQRTKLNMLVKTKAGSLRNLSARYLS